MGYKEDFKDPRWQKKRLEILNRDGFICQGCYDSESTLNVHHLYYMSSRKPWEYPDGALITFCDECHDAEHHREETIIDSLSSIIGDTLLECVPDIIRANLIFTNCGIPPFVCALADAMHEYAIQGHSTSELIEFLESKNKGVS
jgi:hypothetical protein